MKQTLYPWQEECLSRWMANRGRGMVQAVTGSGKTRLALEAAARLEEALGQELFGWGPEYHGAAKIKLWFDEWNTRGTVLQWDIKQYFHKGNKTIVEWYFKNTMHNGKVEAFDGMSLIEWTPDDKIQSLKEFGCNTDNYDPYQCGSTPQFKEESSL